MTDPGWGIWVKYPPPQPCGGAILLIKILNCMSGQDQFIKLMNI